MITKIKGKLKKHSIINYKEKNNSIVIFPNTDGFEVGIEMLNKTITVNYNGWHEEFLNEDDALNCFVFGLSSECRLKEFYKGNFPYKWVVENKNDNEWIEDSEVGLLLIPFWKKTKIKILQNNFL